MGEGQGVRVSSGSSVRQERASDFFALIKFLLCSLILQIKHVEKHTLRLKAHKDADQPHIYSEVKSKPGFAVPPVVRC